MTEQQLQGAVIDVCKLLGILWYHTHDSRQSPSGWPDLAMCGERGFIVRELKTETGRLTDAQALWGARLRRVGVRWAVWRPADLLSGRIGCELREIRLGRWVTSCGG